MATSAFGGSQPGAAVPHEEITAGGGSLYHTSLKTPCFKGFPGGRKICAIREKARFSRSWPSIAERCVEQRAGAGLRTGVLEPDAEVAPGRRSNPRLSP